MFRLFTTACLIFLSTQAFPQQLAFPGAEGYGKFTRGGRGGDVIEVTNLNDSGAGSLRAAVEANGPRTVIFRTGGNIRLESDLVIREPFITIAGQTAPGEGICISDYSLVIEADEVIVRHVRVRLGDRAGRPVDAISARFHKNIIIDHVSASWAIDETASVYYCDSITVQWCIISESLHNSVHPKGPHGFGGIWGGNFASYHHNILAHHTSRNPRIASGSPRTDFRNNVIYNWGYNSMYGGEMHFRDDEKWSSTYVNIVNNYFKPGPATQPGDVSHRIVNPSARETEDDYGKWYVMGNHMEGQPDISMDNWAGGVQPQDGAEYLSLCRAKSPFEGTMSHPEETAQQAYTRVLEYAGARKPVLDAVDKRIIEEVRTGTATYEGPSYESRHEVTDNALRCGIIDSPTDVGGWPVYDAGTPPVDSDHDGMPDEWEDLMNLDKNDPSDRNTHSPAGYTMLEEYLNSLCPEM